MALSYVITLLEGDENIITWGCKVLWSLCVHVCLSVGLSVCSYLSQTTRPKFTKFYMLYVLTMAVAQSFSDGETGAVAPTAPLRDRQPFNGLFSGTAWVSQH